MKIAILGGGNMGGAFAKGISKQLEKCEVVVSDKNSAKLNELKKRTNIKTVSNNVEAIKGANVVILAVKPQDFEPFLAELKGKIPAHAIIISIAAGVKIKTIEKGISHRCVARIMPNLLALIDESMSAWIAPNLNPKQKEVVKNILKSVGEEIEMKNEDDINKVTAMSGSGPAYVWYFMENMIKAGVKLGLKEEVARKLTSQTFAGASEMSLLSAETEKELRLRVTSKKGTTEKAIKTLEKGKFGKLIENAIKNAYNRAKELG
ncbi:MAG: pyrroline-5-carboxylate reductase, pyrroline-5-carboxylate reductase [Candidatus Peregrinibacteria bacterium GW2011_GWF2_38_29]|nr:MAG: pyrroline-5-carboxylate reductase, pyrroline-5-carboxylate reductase [Candidatus Peregrinibacteria bacterium GW2011_GWF2_38_29]HBB02455.1 pyrroline-5-carboxylate reductase [Candidatus Peregrinibacteria bacterium]